MQHALLSTPYDYTPHFCMFNKLELLIFKRSFLRFNWIMEWFWNNRRLNLKNWHSFCKNGQQSAAQLNRKKFNYIVIYKKKNISSKLLSACCGRMRINIKQLWTDVHFNWWKKKITVHKLKFIWFMNSSIIDLMRQIVYQTNT